jgi:hypothetical protein
MKATLNIDDAIMAELKCEAARQGRTMSELVEIALHVCSPLNESGGESPPYQSSAAAAASGTMGSGQHKLRRRRVRRQRSTRLDGIDGNMLGWDVSVTAADDADGADANAGLLFWATGMKTMAIRGAPSTCGLKVCCGR